MRGGSGPGRERGWSLGHCSVLVEAGDRAGACSRRGKCPFPVPVSGSAGKSERIPRRRAQPPVFCARGLSGLCPSSARGTDTALLLSGSAEGDDEVMSPAPVAVVPDWAIALLVLVSILLLLSIFTCLLLMVRPHAHPSAHLPSTACCPVPTKPRPLLSPQVHLHLPPEKPREAGPAQPEGFLPPHG